MEHINESQCTIETSSLLVLVLLVLLVLVLLVFLLDDLAAVNSLS